MKISVIIPSHIKRSHDLALTSVTRQTHKSYEVIIVKNGANKNSYLSNGSIHIYETKQVGLDIARNLGLKKARGDIIAYIDDDILVNPDWLRAIAKSHSRFEAAVIGGKVEPKWVETEKPKWVKGILLDYLSTLDYSDKPTEVGEWGWVDGGNISFKRKVFDVVGLFDEDLDRKEECLLSSGEEELCRRVRRAGEKVYYDPSIVVKHLIPSSRLTPQYFIDRAYWQGVSDFIMDKKVLNRAALKNKFKEMNSEIQFTNITTKGDAFRIVEKLCQYARAIGYMQAHATHLMA